MPEITYVSLETPEIPGLAKTSIAKGFPIVSASRKAYLSAANSLETEIRRDGKAEVHGWV